MTEVESTLLADSLSAADSTRTMTNVFLVYILNSIERRKTRSNLRGGKQNTPCFNHRHEYMILVKTPTTYVGGKE